MVVTVLLGLQSVLMNAQGVINIFSGSIGAPSLTVTVLNNTTGNAPVIVEIGQYVSRGPLPQGSTFNHSYGMFSNMGSIPIYIQTCTTATPTFRFNPAPAWAKDTEKFGNAAITDEFLRSHPSEHDIEFRAKWIKNIIHDEPGRKRLDQELNEWAAVVKEEGISFATTHCENPRTIPLIGINYLLWSNTGQSMNMIIELVGNPKDGYTVKNPPQFATAI